MTNALPRARSAEFAPLRQPDPAPEPDIPDQLWDDQEVDPVAKYLYGWLNRWRQKHPGWWPTQRQIGCELKRSAGNVSRAFAALRASGYIVGDVRFELARPSPRPARVPSSEDQPVLPGLGFDDDPAERCATKPRGSRNKTTGVAQQNHGGRATKPCVLADWIPPAPPLVVSQEEKLTESSRENPEASQSVSFDSTGKDGEEVTEDELSADLAVRACDLFWNATSEKVRQAIGFYGIDFVEQALDVCERKDPRPHSFGYLLGVVKNLRREGIVAAKPEPPPANPGRPEPRTPSEARPVGPEDMPGPAELPAVIERALGSGPLARGWRSSLLHWVSVGLVSVGAEQRARLEELQTKDRPGALAKVPPGRIGDPSRTRPNLSMDRCPRQNQTLARPDQLAH